MSVRFINDWKYLFSKYAIGGRFSAFTFVNIAYMNSGEQLIDGLTVIILGLGFSVKRG